MPTISDKELSDEKRALWLKACSAVELRNYGYAISLLSAVLKEFPGFLDGRKILRRVLQQSFRGQDLQHLVRILFPIRCAMNRAARFQKPARKRVGYDAEGGPILDRTARVHEFSFPEDFAPGRLTNTLEPDERRISDRARKPIHNMLTDFFHDRFAHAEIALWAMLAPMAVRHKRR